MDLDCVVLGSAGTYPTAKRNTTSLYLKSLGSNVIVDCGQGFQRRILEYNLPFFADVIVLSHYHSDHWLGLLAYLGTLNSMNRQTELTIYSPESVFLKNAVDSIIGKGKLRYPINYITIVPGIEYLHTDISLSFFEVDHSILCYGVLLESLNNIKYSKEQFTKYNLTAEEIKLVIKQGQLYKNNQTLYSKDFIESEDPYFRVIVSGDTTINSKIWNLMDDKTFLIHECTHIFESDLIESTKKKHTHYLNLVSKYKKENLKYSTLLYHLGAKITPEYLKKIKIPPNIKFAYDGLKVTINSKKPECKYSNII